MQIFKKLGLNPLQIFQLLRFVTTLLIGILLAKIFGLNTGEIAIYELLLFFGNFFSFFWISAGIKSILSQYSQPKVDQLSLLWNLAFLLFLFGIVSCALLYFSQDVLVAYFTQFDHLDHIHLISIFLIFNAPAALIEYIYLLQKKEKYIVPYGLVVFGSQLLVIIVPLSLQWGIQGIFQGLVLWSFGKFFWLLKILWDDQRGNQVNPLPLKLNWQQQKQLLTLIFPLSLHMLIGGGMEYVDGFIVTSQLKEEGLFAIFRYGARELPLVTILTAALTATLIPLAVESQSLAINKIKEEVAKLSKWLFPLTIGLMWLSPFLFPLIYTEDFTQSARIFNIYLLIISSRLLLPQVILYAKQHNYILVWSAVLELMINLSLSLILVKEYGLEGIAFATVIAYLVNKIILILYNYFRFNIPLSSYLDIKVYLVSNLFLMIGYLISLKAGF